MESFLEATEVALARAKRDFDDPPPSGARSRHSAELCLELANTPTGDRLPPGRAGAIPPRSDGPRHSRSPPPANGTKTTPPRTLRATEAKEERRRTERKRPRRHRLRRAPRTPHHRQVQRRFRAKRARRVARGEPPVKDPPKPKKETEGAPKAAAPAAVPEGKKKGGFFGGKNK